MEYSITKLKQGNYRLLWKMATAFLPVFFLASCGNIRDVEIENIEEIKLKTLKGSKATVEVKITVNNRSAHNIYLKKADFEILREGYSFATAIMTGKYLITKHSRQTQVLMFNLDISDRMLIVSGRIRAVLAGEDRTKLSLAGKIRAGTKILSKNIKIYHEL
ncbi:MAG: hypothetical protein LBD59_07135 [Prevotellaceae bacterium]|nr:hypothetical protein [Prevotellaceae bacterium]